MDEDIELKLIKQLEQKEKDRAERFEKLIYENTKSFEDFLFESLSRKLKNVKLNPDTPLEDFLLEDRYLADIPVDAVLTNNIKNELEIRDIINTRLKVNTPTLNKNPIM